MKGEKPLSRTHRQYDSIENAIGAVNQLAREATAAGWKLLAVDVGRHVYPGDVFNAYEELGLTPSRDHVCEPDRCGPLAAVLLHQDEGTDAINWRQGLAQFDSNYVSGFEDGYQLIVPADCTGDDAFHRYLRGVYDGVMANAAVF